MVRHIAIAVVVVLVILIGVYVIFSVFGRHLERTDPEARYGATFSFIVIILKLTLCIALVPLGAVFLRVVAKWIGSIDVKFGEACVTLLVASLIAAPISFCCVYLIPHSIIPFFHYKPIILCFLPIMLILQVPALSWRLSISLGKASLISLVMLLIFGILAIPFIARELYHLR
jgi:hypothetical protein